MPRTARKQESETELWRQLIVLASQVNTALDRVLVRKHGVTLSELLTLSSLAVTGDEGMRIQALADAVGLNQSSMSRLTTKLQQSGLAQRCSCLQDRRGTYARATEAGRALAREAQRTYDEELSRILDEQAFDERTAALVARLRYDIVANRPAG